MVVPPPHPILAAIVAAPSAWLTPQEIATCLSQEVEYVTDALCALDAAGWLSVEADRDEPVVTLSQHAITTLHVELIETRESFRWRTIWPGPKPKPQPPALDQVESRDLGPLDACLFEEAYAEITRRRRERRERRGLPLRPEDVAPPNIILLGRALWPWTEADKAPRPSVLCPECTFGRRKKRITKAACERCGRNTRPYPKPGVCPGCRCRLLSDGTYCPRCNRWGWDERTSKPPAQRKQA